MEVLFSSFLTQCILAPVLVFAKDNHLNVPIRKIAVSVGSPLVLNCSTPWNNTLVSQNLTWKHNYKAWLFDRSTRLSDSRTIQLYIPKVTYADNGTYQCCVYDELGETVCIEPAVTVFVGEKPDVSGLSFRMSYYGYPPQLINITWSTVSNRGKHDNGKPWKYEILYRNVFRDQLCSRRNVNKVAGWCTRYSSSNKGFFSCDFTRAYTRSSHLDMHRLCCSIVVTNGFGTQTLKHPYTFSNFHENAICTKPRNITLEPSGRRQLTIRFEPPLHMPKGEPLLYKITYCNLGSKTVSKISKTSTACNTTPPHSDTTINLLFLQDYTQYSVSVSCKRRYNTQLEGGLVAGPYYVTTREAAPDDSPRILSWRPTKNDRKTCTTNRRVFIEWKPPSPTSWNGRPRKFIFQYWPMNNVNGTKMTNLTLHPNVSFFASGSTVVTNIEIGCFVGYKVQIKMCTVKCGRWSADIVVSGYKRPTSSREAETLTWKQILPISVGAMTVCACAVGVVYCLYRKLHTITPMSTYLTTLDVRPFTSDEPSDAPLFDDSQEYDDCDMYDSTQRTYDIGTTTDDLGYI